MPIFLRDNRQNDAAAEITGRSRGRSASAAFQISVLTWLKVAAPDSSAVRFLFAAQLLIQQDTAGAGIPVPKAI